MQWALRDPSRFLQERTDLEQLATEASWLRACAWRINGDLIEVDLDLEIHGITYAATLTYPDVFPETPAYIRPRDGSLRWSNHQYGPGGSLCLEWRADNWDRRVTGADLVKSAYKLVATETHPTQPARVPSAHHLTEGQKLRSSEYRLVCTPALLTALAAIQNGTHRKLRKAAILHSSTTVAFISKLEGADGQMTKIDDLPAGVSTYFPLFAWSDDGAMLKCNAVDRLADPSSFDDLVVLLHEIGFASDVVLVRDQETNVLKSQMVLLVGEDANSLRAFAVTAGEKPAVQRYDVILPQIRTTRLPAESGQLAGLRFAIVGAGSVGSKIAVSLARSGARRFLLVDDDYLAPENICRHELSWAGVGTNKVDALREALTLIAPNLDVQVRSHRVAGQESAVAAATALKDLGTCDVLIDATADPGVFLRLAAIATRAKRPLCWGEIFAGGIGGIIARARPDIDPNPAAVRSAILAYLATLPPAPFQTATAYDVDAQDPLTAYDSDVAQIAATLTGLILDTALRRDPSFFPYSVYLIGMRKEWIFSQPFDTRPVAVGGAGWDAAADAPITAGAREEALKALLQIAAEGQHADAGPAG